MREGRAVDDLEHALDRRGRHVLVRDQHEPRPQGRAGLRRDRRLALVGVGGDHGPDHLRAIDRARLSRRLVLLEQGADAERLRERERHEPIVGLAHKPHRQLRRDDREVEHDFGELAEVARREAGLELGNRDVRRDEIVVSPFPGREPGEGEHGRGETGRGRPGRAEADAASAHARQGRAHRSRQLPLHQQVKGLDLQRRYLANVRVASRAKCGRHQRQVDLPGVHPSQLVGRLCGRHHFGREAVRRELLRQRPRHEVARGVGEPGREGHALVGRLAEREPVGSGDPRAESAEREGEAPAERAPCGDRRRAHAPGVYQIGEV